MNKRILRNIGIVFSGSAFSQAVFFVAIIFLTRLYSPAAFGTFAIFLAWANILGLLFTARYETVIPLPTSPKEAGHLLWGTLGISFAFLFLTVLLSPIIDASFRNETQLHPLWIILGAYFTGCISIIQFLLVRWGQYAMLSGIRILLALGISGIQLGLYTVAPAMGLVNGYLLGSGLAIFVALVFTIQRRVELPKPSQIKATLQKYYSVIRWSLPSSLLNATINNIQPVLIGLTFDNREAGLFFLTYKVMGTPVSLISSSISQIFIKEAVVALQTDNNQQLLRLMKNISGIMAVALSLFSVVIALLASFFFSMVFGEEWERSALIATWLIPYFFGKGIFHPVSYIAEVLNKAVLEMQFSVVSLLNLLAAIVLGYYFESLKIFILAFSISTGMAYLVLWLVFYRIVSQGKYERKV